MPWHAVAVHTLAVATWVIALAADLPALGIVGFLVELAYAIWADWRKGGG